MIHRSPKSGWLSGRPRSAELLDDVRHGVGMADDQHRPRRRPRLRDQRGRIGGIVDDRRQAPARRDGGGGLPGAAEIADQDRARRMRRQPGGQRRRDPLPFRQQIGVALSGRRVEMAHDIEGRRRRCGRRRAGRQHRRASIVRSQRIASSFLPYRSASYAAPRYDRMIAGASRRWSGNPRAAPRRDGRRHTSWRDRASCCGRSRPPRVPAGSIRMLQWCGPQLCNSHPVAMIRPSRSRSGWW